MEWLWGGNNLGVLDTAVYRAHLAAFDIHDVIYIGDDLIDDQAAADAGAFTTGLCTADEFTGCESI